MPPVFNLVVLGSGGGPDETNLSAYLLKTADSAWEDGIVALEAGSGQGALARLLRDNPKLFHESSNTDSSDNNSSNYTAAQIYSFIRAFLISHAHLDHISGLVLSAGSLSGPRRRVYGASCTLKDLECVFSDRIWPNLASWNESDESYKLLYTALPLNNYVKLHPGISVRLMPVSHGHDSLGNHESAAFFIRHDASSREFLFFGDVEPDTLSAKPQNSKVWRETAPKIPAILSTIFIECSWSSGRKDNMLYGHLTPEHLVDELCVLAAEVVMHRKGIATTSKHARLGPFRKKQKTNPIPLEDLRGALAGVRIVVIHCKDNGGEHAPNNPIREIIAGQVEALIRDKGLGAGVICAEPGMNIVIWALLS
ncbi:hypothetical protein AX16_008677 [Volvariella volvacea WC 439]|nr:hypothetical protein AX16_008677 [Volvariella volvacea WC 439]